MTLILLWLAVLGVSLFILVKGAQWLLGSAETIGRFFNFSPFLIGVLILGIGTSLPELVSSLYAVFVGETNIVVANVLGSNIANILLIVGAVAVLARSINVQGTAIDVDFPLLAVATALLVFITMDGEVSRGESFVLLMGMGLYFLYLFQTNTEAQEEKEKQASPSITTWVLLVVGLISLALGAKYAIDSVIMLSVLTGIGTGVIALFAVALGTSLPELVVSIEAARKGKSEMIFGNIFGSNMINILLVVGIPGVFGTLLVDAETLRFGVPMFVAATVIFLVAGLSGRIRLWEGAFLLFLYSFFILTIFGIL